MSKTDLSILMLRTIISLKDGCLFQSFKVESTVYFNLAKELTPTKILQRFYFGTVNLLAVRGKAFVYNDFKNYSILLRHFDAKNRLQFENEDGFPIYVKSRRMTPKKRSKSWFLPPSITDTDRYRHLYISVYSNVWVESTVFKTLDDKHKHD